MSRIRLLSTASISGWPARKTSRPAEPAIASIRQDIIEEALETPMQLPNTRNRLITAAASPDALAGAAAIVALLLGVMNRPSPTPNMANAARPETRLPIGFRAITD